MNINCESFNPSGDCDPGGMYFSREDILAFLDYGPWIRQVTLCPDSKIYLNPGQPVKWKTDKFILGERREITVDVIKQLIDEGSNINVDNLFPLRWSCKNGYFKIVKYLVEKKVNFRTSNDNPLRMASFYGHLDIVKFLVEKGADIHSIDDNPLRMASCNGHLDIVKFLVEKGADIHVKENRALKLAFEHNHLDIVEYFKGIINDKK